MSPSAWLWSSSPRATAQDKPRSSATPERPRRVIEPPPSAACARCRRTRSAPTASGPYKLGAHGRRAARSAAVGPAHRAVHDPRHRPPRHAARRGRRDPDRRRAAGQGDVRRGRPRRHRAHRVRHPRRVDARRAGDRRSARRSTIRIARAIRAS